MSDGDLTLVGTALRPGGAPGNRGHLARIDPASGIPDFQRIVSGSFDGVGISLHFTDVVEYAGGGAIFIVGYAQRGPQRDVIFILGNADLSIHDAAILDLPGSDETNISVEVNGPELVVAAASRTLGAPEPDETFVLRLNPTLPPPTNPARWIARIPRLVVGPRGVAYEPGPTLAQDRFLVSGYEVPGSTGAAATIALDGAGTPLWSRRYGTADGNERFNAIENGGGNLIAVGSRSVLGLPVNGYSVFAGLDGVTNCLDQAIDLPAPQLSIPIREIALNVEDFNERVPLPLRFVRRLQEVQLCPAPCDPDVNCDGNVDQDDVECLEQAVAGEFSCICVDPDFNQDGNVDQDDIEALVQVVAGQPCP
ncbi:MAG: hypothetical protein SFY69_05320 [Planctomycetota bacterium]|nr:hypothetical protein [Planctomycetota bacterium]